MQRCHWLAARSSRLEHILEDLREGIVIVEGKHDVDALFRLGINAVAYAAFMAGGLVRGDSPGTDKTYYVMMDADKGGHDKAGKVVGALLERNPEARCDTTLGQSFLRILGITSVEQAYGKAHRVLPQIRGGLGATSGLADIGRGITHL